MAVMTTLIGRLLGLCSVLVALVALTACSGAIKPGNARASKPLAQAAVSRLASMGSSPAAPLMMRIYKESNELEVWKEVRDGSFKLFKTYAICAWSGGLGPKIKEGDRQSPEGFYTITPALMNPNSSYYLAFNTGFPNKFDRAWGRTGSDLMVHGDCSSRGCYSMTDESIAEIYALARESFAGGNGSFQLQIYPFRMTPQNLALHARDPNMPFWRQLKEGYDRTEIAARPPTWDVCDRRYVFGVAVDAALVATAACPAGAGELPASVAARQAADDQQVARLVAANDARAARAADEARKEAQATAAARARGQAIGAFIGGMFGGGEPAATVDPSIVPPVPATPPANRV
jgi:murein L,D-transpeptidase YafK